LNKILSRRHDEKLRSFKSVKTTDGDIIAYLRFNRKDKYLILINNSESIKQKVEFEDKKLTKKVGKIIFSKQGLLPIETPFRISLNNLILLPRDFFVIKLKH
jgi:hypothetical protein